MIYGIFGGGESRKWEQIDVVVQVLEKIGKAMNESID